MKWIFSFKKWYPKILHKYVFLICFFLFVSLASTGSSSNFHQISSFDFTSTNTLSEDSVVVVGKGILKLFSFLVVCFLHVWAKHINKE